MSSPGPFEFATAGRVIVGAGRAAELPATLAGLGSRALVCTGSRPARHAGLIDGLGVPAAVFPVTGEPTVDVARSATGAARKHGADLVLAIGGGSVIDLGKAVAMLLATAATRSTTSSWSGAGSRSRARPSRTWRCPQRPARGPRSRRTRFSPCPNTGSRPACAAP